MGDLWGGRLTYEVNENTGIGEHGLEQSLKDSLAVASTADWIDHHAHALACPLLCPWDGRPRHCPSLSLSLSLLHDRHHRQHRHQRRHQCKAHPPHPLLLWCLAPLSHFDKMSAN